MELAYIIDKIEKAELAESPFKHLEIRDLFEQRDFEEVVRSPDIAIKAAKDDEALFTELFASNYRIVSFPGCTEDYKEYIRWHKDKRTSHKSGTSTAGYGVVLRLQSPRSSAIQAVNEFINSSQFIECIAAKFGIQGDACAYDSGIQKYLDGYEISPHPDIRQKALTFMVNINPSSTSFDDEYHTSYLRFRPEWNYVQEFWKGNQQLDRCWVPWEWCDVIKRQRDNNSMVIFAPSNDTIHAVKASYDHLSHQRTQLYGNLWFKDSVTEGRPKWEDLVIEASADERTEGGRMKQLASRVTGRIRRAMTGSGRKDSTHAARGPTR